MCPALRDRGGVDLTACREGVEAVLMLFSQTSQEGWLDLSHMLAAVSQANDRGVVIGITTRCEQFAIREVTEMELESFEATHVIPVLKNGRQFQTITDEKSSLAPVMDFLQTAIVSGSRITPH
ncbi:ciliogenesis and planar polarity effector 2-like [Macrobrachium nipponense]|uniref:ciliogenesis and planar polarity effector 2-like n=1 Tax=Macrobrachium nipponense TaxID=159736 RepID=UPI0030C85F13